MALPVSARIPGERPRVLFFSHETTLSGAPIALFHLACSLQESGRAPVIAAPERGPISELLEARNIEVLIDATFLIDPAHEKLTELCGGFDVVVANTIASWPAVRAARAAGARAVWYLHETLVAIELIGKISEIRPTLEEAHLLITPTQQTARVYQGITRTLVEVVPYGIPEPNCVTESGRNADKRLKFVALGSYEPRKGQDVLLDAIRALSPDVRSATSFTLAGRVLDEPFFANLKKTAAEFENVELAPALDHTGSLQLLAECDVLVCASRDETMPISILEAMSLGKLVVSADLGGISEWLRDGVNGFLVPPEDPARLARAITACVSAPQSRRTFGAAARRTFEHHFTLRQFGSRFAAVLDAMVNGPAAVPRAPAITYGEWVARYDTATDSDRIALHKQLRGLRNPPRISILLPVYNADLKLLAAAVDSARRQSYPYWQLCVADDASTDSAVRPFLEALATADERIAVTFRESNGHISAASNSALELATGEWCALLDQDDALVEHALALVALEVTQHPEARVVYSDEDKIDIDGARSNPFFKTDWNPELFQGQNYINHLGVYHTALLRGVGGFREGFEGSQDYDVASRCCETLRLEQVRHIPRILYHWRMAPGSLAEVPDAKPYAKEAARRALADHLERRGISGRVEPCPENTESHRVIYALPTPTPLVTIIILTRDRVELLRQCVQSISDRTDYSRFEILIFDNGSKDAETLDYLQGISGWEGMTVMRNEEPFNFSRLNNLAVRHARGEILAFLNNDIEATEPGWLTEMVSHAARAEVGAVGARLWYPDGTLQHGGVVLGLGGVAGHAHHRVPQGHPGYFNRAFLQQNCSAVTAACMLTRKDVFLALGGFDERNLSINFNDIDYCVRLDARGLQVVWTPYANLIHHESASRGHHPTPAQQAQFRREATFMQEKHGAALLHDPFYSPNLSLKLPGFEIAAPPRLSAMCARESA